MAVITTFVCDVSGFTSTVKSDFVEVTIQAIGYTKSMGDSYYQDSNRKKTTTKLVSKAVADKLNLIHPAKDVEAQPEPTLESKLLTLMRDYIQEIAYEAGGEAGSEAASNYNRG